MDIQIKWFDKQFNVGIASEAGREPFVEIKGCRIVDGSKGPFVSWPATKNESTGKWWNHVYGSDKFNAVVLSKAQAAMPAGKPAQRQQAPRGGSGGFEDMDSDVPFRDPMAGKAWLAL